MIIQPYLQFDGRAEEAVRFYEKALGAKVEMLLRYKDTPGEPPPGMVPPGSEDKIMHVAMRIGDILLMGSDGRCGGKPQFDGIDLALSVADPGEAKRMFDGLADGGEIRMKLQETFFSSCFGELKDRFGVTWLIVAPPAAQPA